MPTTRLMAIGKKSWQKISYVKLSFICETIRFFIQKNSINVEIQEMLRDWKSSQWQNEIL